MGISSIQTLFLIGQGTTELSVPFCYFRHLFQAGVGERVAENIEATGPEGQTLWRSKAQSPLAHIKEI